MKGALHSMMFGKYSVVCLFFAFASSIAVLRSEAASLAKTSFHGGHALYSSKYVFVM